MGQLFRDRDRGIAPWVKMPATKQEDPSLIPKTYDGRRAEAGSDRLSSDLCLSTMSLMGEHTCTDT